MSFISACKLSESYTLPRYNFNRIDKRIWSLAKPASVNYIMVPFVGFVDTLCVSKLGTPIDLAGVGAGDQIFSMFYCIMSFLPIILTPEITKLHVKKKYDELSNISNISLILSSLFGTLISFLLITKCLFITSIFVNINSPIHIKTIEYLKYRSIALPFCLVNSVIFSILRGLLDFSKAIKINILTQIINIIFNPIFMAKYGVKGIAISSVISEILCTIGYLKILINKKCIKYKIKKCRYNIRKLLSSGIFIQIRLLLINFIDILINKRLIHIDTIGNYLAANLIIFKFINIVNILYYSIYSVCNIIIPSERLINKDVETKNKLIIWTTTLGILQSLLFYNLRYCIHFFSDNKDVIKITTELIPIATIYQILFGFVLVLEGILQGYQKYRLSCIVNIITSLPFLCIINYMPSSISIWKISIIYLLSKTSLITSFIY